MKFTAFNVGTQKVTAIKLVKKRELSTKNYLLTFVLKWEGLFFGRNLERALVIVSSFRGIMVLETRRKYSAHI